jgi:hypothetical protein
MILDEAHLLSDQRIAQIFDRSANAPGLRIGVLQKEGLPVALPFIRVFNSHIGIFGSTGSGRSNTLTKLYTALFDRNPPGLSQRSRLMLVDFNGEYTQAQLVDAPHKRVLDVSTGRVEGGPHHCLDRQFWNVETLALLFQATQHTQRPFLNRVIEGRRKFGHLPDSITRYFRDVVKKTFTSARPSGPISASGLARSRDQAHPVMIVPAQVLFLNFSRHHRHRNDSASDLGRRFSELGGHGPNLRSGPSNMRATPRAQVVVPGGRPLGIVMACGRAAHEHGLPAVRTPALVASGSVDLDDHRLNTQRAERTHASLLLRLRRPVELRHLVTGDRPAGSVGQAAAEPWSSLPSFTLPYAPAQHQASRGEPKNLNDDEIMIRAWILALQRR